MSSSEIARFADVAMWVAPEDPTAQDEGGVHPTVTLVHMTHDPIRVMAAASEMYRGRIARGPSDVDRATAMKWWDEMTKTKLKAPLEFIDLHFLFEGVTRAFTHQLVRQRTAVYVQESLRFAVKENAAFEVAYPPSLIGLKEDDPKRVTWDAAIAHIAMAYNRLINAGVPAEDARGLLPTNITTRVHYKTNLRNLAEHAGLRLCSQGQYEWKVVWAGMLNAIRYYGEEDWQTEAILRLFKPVCYQTGRCEFRGANDRHCSIRERVETHHKQGEGPELWNDISPLEPLLEGAARKRPGA